MPNPVDVSKELKAFDLSYSNGLVGGMDEAGRGPLAGPVVCAAAVFDSDTIIPYVNDSKKLSEKRRELVYEEIINRAKCIGIGISDHETIDRINILEATKTAMLSALKNLSTKPDILLIDAVKLDTGDIPNESLTKGDAKSFAIAAASIVAKVTRDRFMKECAQKYPGYGFEQHKGYGTKAHYEAIKKLGFCEIHRRTFLKTLH